MKRWITTSKGKYLIRGDWTVEELKRQYEAFTTKYKSNMPFDEWLGAFGKVHFRKDRTK